MDGSILSQYLITKGYQVYGMVRRTTNRNLNNLVKVLNHPNFHLIEGDVTDQNSILRAINKSNCNVILHLAAQSFVFESFITPENTANINALGTLRVLQAIRESGRKNEIKMYNAATSECFGKMIENPANENTPFYPRSPYGVSKVFAYFMTKNYRQSYDMFAVSGIAFNHQAPLRRGVEFVSRKITIGIKDIIDGKKDYIELGNIEAKRDWGAAIDYIKAMFLMLQNDKPEDYVIGTGQTHSVREFLELAFNRAGLDNYNKYIKINPQYFRPAQVDVLRADYSKINRELGWKPTITFQELVYGMVDAELTGEIPEKFRIL